MFAASRHKLLSFAAQIFADRWACISDTAIVSAKAGDCLHNYFTKLVKDNYLWQLVDFLTRGKNILDLIFATVPTKVQDIHGFDDIICTDHKLISFELDLKVPKRSKTKRVEYNFKRADWSGLKETFRNIPWDACIVPDDVDASLE